MKRLHGRFVVFAARCLPGSMLEQLLMHAYAALLAPHSAHVVLRCALPAYPFSLTRNHTHDRMPLVHARAGGGGGLQHGTGVSPGKPALDLLSSSYNAA